MKPVTSKAAAKMYANSPTITRDPETGRAVRSQRAEEAAPAPESADTVMGVAMRHALERRDLVVRFENEHAKAEKPDPTLYERQAKEFQELGARHAQEI